MKTFCFWTFGLNVRDFFVALRSQRPPWVWRMCRPNIVVFAQTSQAPLAMRHRPLRAKIESSCYHLDSVTAKRRHSEPTREEASSAARSAGGPQPATRVRDRGQVSARFGEGDRRHQRL